VAKLTFLDLFAGCGGMSLGLKCGGFEPLVAIEKSKMAAETYFHNFHRSGDPDSDAWAEHLDFVQNKDYVNQAKRGVVVAGVEEVLNDDATMQWLEKKQVDVLVGGPPCQGFSMAGRRNSDDRRNQLPQHFIKYIEKLRPRAVVVENVQGINRRFADSAGREATTDFEELCRRIARIKVPGKGKLRYVVQPLELNAADYGVPQHRPRMFIVAVEADAVDMEADGDPLPLWRSRDFPFERVPPLAPRPSHSSKPVPAGEALCDFEAGTYKLQKRPPKQEYEERFSRYAWERRNDRKGWQKDPDSHEHRRHNPKTKERFGLYRDLANLGIPSSVFALAARRRPGGARTNAVEGFLRRAKGADLSEEDVRNLARQISDLPTRKHSQQVLHPAKPSPTVLTIPDDLIHPYEDRVMTVRELARLQSFPDSFTFHGRVTTGGERRKDDVPRYTQVGNAVPPLLAKAIGQLLDRLIPGH